MCSFSFISGFLTLITWSNDALMNFMCFATQNCWPTSYKETIMGDINTVVHVQRTVPPWLFNIFSIHFHIYKSWLKNFWNKQRNRNKQANKQTNKTTLFASWSGITRLDYLYFSHTCTQTKLFSLACILLITISVHSKV